MENNIFQEKSPENANIKEKLSFHVKRRIQETDEVNQLEEASLASQDLDSPQSVKPKQKKGGPKAKKAKVPKADEDSLSNADKDEEAAESPSQKQPKGPCVLDLILNTKKVSLMKDPEVVEFFKNMTHNIKKE